MIYDYEIKHKNHEEVLCIYLDISQEFAKLNAKTKKKKLKTLIKEYIKNNKIMFKGTTAIILVSGMVVGTLVLENPKKDVKSLETFTHYTISALKDENIPLENEGIFVNNEEQVKEEGKVTEKDLQEKQDVKKETSSVKNTSKDNNSDKITTVHKEQEETLKVEEAKTMVTVYRTNDTVLNLELEEYVIGVVASEMPASFHVEALKSQAILARTYALRALEKNIRLTDNSSTQNYKSIEELKKMWGSSFSTYYNKIKNATEKTEGMYLTYQGEIVDAVYHSTSNGWTEDAKNVWGNSIPYLVSVESPYDNLSSTFLSEKSFSYEELSTKLGIIMTYDTTFEIQSKTEGNRVLNMQIDTQIYTGVALRNLLGLRSATFDVVKKENGVTFVTQGFGHGVGMSQYGANGMAKNGSSYTNILKHYYQGITISHM